MNSGGQIVGRSRTPDGLLHAFLWENGGPMVDLNDLIPSGSNLTLEESQNINDRGEILVWAQPPGCPDDHLCGRLVLLVPCDANDPSACENDHGNTTPEPPPALVPLTAGSAQSSSRGSALIEWRRRLALR